MPNSITEHTNHQPDLPLSHRSLCLIVQLGTDQQECDLPGPMHTTVPKETTQLQKPQYQENSETTWKILQVTLWNWHCKVKDNIEIEI